MKKIFFKVAGLILLFVVGFISAHGIKAQQNNLSLSISPPTFEMSANPGDELTNSIRVSNLSDQPLTVSVDRRNFTAVGEEGSIGLTEEKTGFSLASWIDVLPKEIVIPANKSYSFSFNISVPQNAEPGGHFGSIVFKTGGAEPGQTGAALAQELGALILLRVAGQAHESANLESFKPTKDFYEYGPIEFETRVINEGNVHVKPSGTITISNVFGKKIANLSLEPRNVLPGAIRRFPAILEQKNLLGRYTATLQLTYGSQGETLSATNTFFVFPYKIGSVIIVVLLLIAYALWRGRKRIRYALKVLFSGQQIEEE